MIATTIKRIRARFRPPIIPVVDDIGCDCAFCTSPLTRPISNPEIMGDMFPPDPTPWLTDDEVAARNERIAFERWTS